MTEQELEIIYNAIMNKEVQTANDLVKKQYFSRKQVLKQLSNYVIKKSQEEQAIYREKYKFFLASSTIYFNQVMPLIEELTNTGEIQTKQLEQATNRQFRHYLKVFKSNFPEYEKIVDQIDIIIENCNKTKTGRSINDFYDRYNLETRYEEQFYEIVTSEDPIAVFRKSAWKEDVFYSKLNLFIARYPDSVKDGIIEKLKEWYQQYLMEEMKEKCIDFGQHKNNLSSAKSLVEDLIVSGLSIREYCHKNGRYKIVDIKNYIQLLYGVTYNPETEKQRARKATGDQFIEEVNARESKNFLQEIQYIAAEIENNESFTVIEYYLYTKLDITDFIAILKEEGINSTKIAVFSHKYFSAYAYNQKEGYHSQCDKVNKEEELKTTRIIKDRLITPEEKIAIFGYLEGNDIPLNRYTYRAALTKLANGEEDFIQKLNTYKKDSF